MLSKELLAVNGSVGASIIYRPVFTEQSRAAGPLSLIRLPSLFDDTLLNTSTCSLLLKIPVAEL